MPLTTIPDVKPQRRRGDRAPFTPAPPMGSAGVTTTNDGGSVSNEPSGAEPNVKYMHPESQEYADAERDRLAAVAAKRANEVAHERRKWREARAIYEQTLQLVEQIWGDRLNAAQLKQQNLAEEMRDRRVPLSASDPGDLEGALWGREIPVPLFTPRDRLQFLKEATTAFLIFGEKRGLQALPKDLPAEQQEAGSGTSEEAGEVALAEGTE